MELPLADKSTVKFRRSDSTDRQFKRKKREKQSTGAHGQSLLLIKWLGSWANHKRMRIESLVPHLHHREYTSTTETVRTALCREGAEIAPKCFR